MSGDIRGVRTLMKGKQPGLANIHCVAHKLELCVTDSIKSGDVFKKMQETIGDIFIVYYKSPKKRREIKDLSTLLDETFKQFGSLKHVRWVQSRYRALGIINHNYTALVKHQQEIAASNDKNVAKAKGHVLQLKSPRFLNYLHFSMNFVETIRQTSLFFQKDDLLVCCVLRIINERISVLEALKVQNGKNMRQFLLKLTEDEDGNISFKKYSTE